MWKLELGDLGYLPSQITKQLSSKDRYKLAEIVALSRHSLWTDYWKQFIAILKTTQTSPTPPSTTTNNNNMGENGLVVQQVAPDTPSSTPSKLKNSQRTLHSFFKKL